MNATPNQTTESAKALPNSERTGIGLSLSGGGFRASLFHLGALRRLFELGILQQLTTISSVSGGSIVSAHYACVLVRKGGQPIADWEQEVALPFRKFCSINIRRTPVAEGLLPWKKNSDLLAGEYEDLLTKGMELEQIPVSPRFVFCSTDLAYGVNWVFRRDQCGDYKAGFLDPAPLKWKLSRAVAASSCFPPVFKPMSLHVTPDQLTQGAEPPGPKRDACIRGLTLSDGGVYDNMGLEPIWKDHKVILCSDGGALFDFSADHSFIWEVQRYISIPENQALAVRKRWLISNFIGRILQGTYWGIGGSPASYSVSGGYSKGLATDVIAAIRTDLDSFSDAEAFVLENHGYFLADAAVRTHAKDLIRNNTALRAPHPEYVDEPKVRRDLKNSNKRTLLGRG